MVLHDLHMFAILWRIHIHGHFQAGAKAVWWMWRKYTKLCQNELAAHSVLLNCTDSKTTSSRFDGRTEFHYPTWDSYWVTWDLQALSLDHWWIQDSCHTAVYCAAWRRIQRKRRYLCTGSSWARVLRCRGQGHLHVFQGGRCPGNCIDRFTLTYIKYIYRLYIGSITSAKSAQSCLA